MTIPPAGAADVSVTVPVDEAGPTTLVGLSVRAASVPGGVGAVRVQPDKVAWAELPPPLTEITHVGELKGCVTILKAPVASEVPSTLPSTTIA